MRSMLLAGAGFLALIASPVALTAQDASDTSGASVPGAAALTAEQKTMYDGWPAERRTAYDSWSADYRTYYWTLTADQQSGWWRLTDDQRKTVHDMTPADRTTAWTSIEAQMAGAPPPAATTVVQANPPGPGPATDTPPNPPTAAAAVAPAMPADPNYQAGPYKGALTPPPAEAMTKTYPVCTRQLTDNCQNPGEGGARGRRRSTG